MSYIALLLPSVFGLKIFNNSNKNEKMLDQIIYYFLFVLFSNVICFGILENLGKKINLIEAISLDYEFVLRYATLSIIINFILANLFTIIIKNFNFNIEVEYEKKQKRQKKFKNN